MPIRSITRRPATIPKVFTRPWTLKNQFKRSKAKDPRYSRTPCYEGERDVEVMLHHSDDPQPKSTAPEQ